MKLALVMMFTNELSFLKLHLPVSVQGFDGLVAMTDPNTTDGSIEFMKSMGADIRIADWHYDWGQFATQLFNFAEELGYDAACRLDSDECLTKYAGTEIKLLLQTQAALLCLPRHEFFGSRLNIRPDLYPDDQARCWWLQRGIVVQGKRHEGVWFGQHGLDEHSTDPKTRVLRVRSPSLHIFHYSWISETGIWRNQVKYQRHEQVSAGGPEHVALPADTPLVSWPTVPFDGVQPLDPNEVGIYAPFTDSFEKTSTIEVSSQQ